MRKLLIVPMLFATLAIAAPQGAGAQCTVQKGDSLWKISREYHLNFHQLLKLNKLLKNPNLIYPDQTVPTQPDAGQGNDSKPSDGTNDGDSSNKDEVTDGDRAESTKQAQEVLRLVNAERSKRGLSALTLDSTLNKVATVKARDMAENGYFSHDSPTYGSPFEMLRAFGVTQYMSAGENIAAGQKTPAAVMESWMNSSGHRANILSSKFTHLGVGYYKGGSYGTYWVQTFTQQAKSK